MIDTVSPNRVIAFAVLTFVAYWIAAMLVQPVLLRDVFNSLSFGTSLLVVLTWARPAYRAVRLSNDNDGAWILVLAIFFINFVALSARIYSITFNAMGRPEAWAVSAISGFWPYSYTIAGLMFLISPGVKSDGVRPRALWTLLAAVAIGGIVAGIMIGLSISTVI